MIRHDPLSPESIKRLKADLARNHQKVERYQEALTRLSLAVGWACIVKEEGGFVSHAFMQVDHLKEYLNYWVQKFRTQYGVDIFTEWGKREEGKVFLTIRDLVRRLRIEYESRLQRIETIKEEITKLEEEMHDLRTQISDDWDRHNREIFEGGVEEGAMLARVKEILQLRRNLQDRILQDLDQQEKLSEEFIKEVNRYTLIRSAHQIQRRQLEKDLHEMRERLDWLTLGFEEAKAKKEADGKIVSVDRELGLVYLDLGRLERVIPGMLFKVYSLKKGGTKADRGLIRLVEVGEKHSKGIIVVEPSPIREGDFVYDEFFEPGRPRTFAFAGELIGRIPSGELAKLIRGFGDKFTPVANAKTDFLVVGRGYEKDPNYAIAQKWGIKVIREKDLYRYLGLTW
jgi:hypothetical protein